MNGNKACQVEARLFILFVKEIPPLVCPINTLPTCGLKIV